MVQRHELYKCEKCGNIVEVLQGGGGPLRCCGEKMDLVTENTVDAAVEKHIPVVEKIEGGVRVTVGAVEHPMLEAHYILWIEVADGETIQRKYLKPDEKPVAEFKVTGDNIITRAYCNIHGNWKA